MNQFLKVLSQILFVAGLTLMLGGIASFLFTKVELRLFGQQIITENARIIWIVISGTAALAGLALHLARKRKA